MMMPEPVRTALPSDVPAMAKIVNDWIDETAWMPRAEDREAIEAMIREALPMRELWVVGDPAQAYLSYNKENGRISGFYSAKPGTGLGKVLLDRVKLGRYSIWLHTHEANEAARRFYTREGFVETAKIAAEPPEILPEIRMEWRR